MAEKALKVNFFRFHSCSNRLGEAILFTNMIKLFSLKQQKKDGEQTSKTGTQKKASAAQLRIQKGMDKTNDK